MRGGVQYMRVIHFSIKSIILLLSVKILIGCSSSPESANVEERDGLLFICGQDKVFSGKIVDTVANRIIEYTVVEGKKNGEFKISSVNGAVQMVGNLKDNLNQGQWRYFYPNGQLESIGNFDNNLSEGKWTWYFENGKIKEIGYFKSGKKDGNWTIYDEKGNIKRKAEFKDGQMIFNQEFDKDFLT